MQNLRDRFIVKIAKSLTFPYHWTWSGGKSVRVGGQSITPRRAVWEYFKGPVPPGSVVVGKCGNLKCVSPEEGHGALLTKGELGKQALISAKVNAGAKEATEKLTYEQARELWVASRDMGEAALARRFKISIGAVQAVLDGQAWPRNPPPSPLTNNPS